jgi:sulfoxide reductase heme-binding subunit YedZ
MPARSFRRPHWLQIAAHLGALLPFAILVRDYFTGNLTFNPIQEATIRTGKTALSLIVLTLAITPLNFLTGWHPLIRIRRPLGLYAFFYASLHFLIFIWLDYGLVWAFIKEGFLKKPYALVGFTAFLLLLPLALTSTKGWQRRLGKRWKKLHRLIYVIGLLVIVHYIWVVKSDTREPLLWGAGIVLLLALRNSRIKQWAGGMRRKNPPRIRQGTDPAAGGRVSQRDDASP